MNRISRLFLLSTVTLLPFAAFAGPNPAIVPADAKWMVYADFAAMRSSTLGKELVALVEKEMAGTEAPVIPNLQKILTTVGSATAYGTNFSDKPEEMDGILVVQGTPDLRKIAESLLISQNIASPEHVVELNAEFGYPAYGIKSGPPPKPAKKDGEDEKAEDAPKVAKKATAPRDPNKIELIIAFPPKPDNIILISRAKALINRAKDLANGTGASLAKNNASPLKRFLTGVDDAHLFVATLKPDNKVFPEAGAQGRILQMATSGSLSIGEHGPETYAHLEVIASSENNADKMFKIMQGLTATMSLMETNDRQLGEFLNAATTNRDGDKVVMNLAYPSARLVQMANNFKSINPPQANRPPQGPYVSGKAVAKWNGAAYAAPADAATNVERSHVIENVELKAGSTITLARSLNGARYSRFLKVEAAPVGGGNPLTFTSFSQASGRNAASFEFPMDGTYNLKVVTQVGDPEGKVEYACSVRDPRMTPPAVSVPAPAPKGK